MMGGCRGDWGWTDRPAAGAVHGTYVIENLSGVNRFIGNNDIVSAERYLRSRQGKREGERKRRSL